VFLPSSTRPGERENDLIGQRLQQQLLNLRIETQS